MSEILLFLAGTLAGIINTVAGGGVLFVFGGLLQSGLSPLSAAMTSSAITWPGSITATFGYRKHLRNIPKHYYALIIPSVIGSGIGAFLLTRTSTDTFEVIVPWLVFASVCLFAFQPKLHTHVSKPARLRIMSPFMVLIGVLFICALYGGYFGAGFGFIVLAILGFTKLKNIYQISGMKNVITASISCCCMIIFALHGGIVWDQVAIPALGTVTGGLIGSRLAPRMSPKLSRALIILMGIIIVGMLSNKLN